MDRHLDWPGSYNMRDLGGLPTRDGRRTLWGAVVRGDEPDQLTETGWAALRAHGIRMLVDLRGDTPGYRPGDVTTVRLPLDDLDDTEFWQRWGDGLDCTPLCYQAFLDRFPNASRACSGPSRTRRPAVCSSTAAAAVTEPDSSSCCCSRSSTYPPRRSPPTTS